MITCHVFLKQIHTYNVEFLIFFFFFFFFQEKKKKKHRDRKSSDSDSSDSESDTGKRARHTSKDSKAAKKKKKKKKHKKKHKEWERSIEGGWEKESGACALKPWLLERLSSKNMASHPLLSHGRWRPLVPQASLEARYQKHLPEWVVPLSLLGPLQVTPAALPFIHPPSFSRRSYYPLQLPLPEPDSCTGVQARATGTAVGWVWL